MLFALTLVDRKQYGYRNKVTNRKSVGARKRGQNLNCSWTSYQYSESLQVGDHSCFFLLAGADTQGSAQMGGHLPSSHSLVLVPLSNDAKAMEHGPGPNCWESYLESGPHRKKAKESKTKQIINHHIVSNLFVHSFFWFWPSVEKLPS